MKKLQTRINEYFESCYQYFPEPTGKTNEEGTPETKDVKQLTKPFTVDGLAVWLDMTPEELVNAQERELILAVKKCEAFLIEKLSMATQPGTVEALCRILTRNFTWTSKI